MILPSNDFATPEKFFATNLCRSSPAQIGYIPILTLRLMAAPTAINTNLLIAMDVNFPALNPEIVTMQKVSRNTRNPYSYGFIFGCSFVKVAANADN
jgi:hypothetical protein